MPEGHSIHRLAQAFTTLKSVVKASSPQGRFQAGAELLDGMELKSAWAWGKHLFLGFSSAQVADSAQETTGESGDEEVTEQILHVHLGLYGSWKFYVLADLDLPTHIGAPRYIGEHLGDQVNYLDSSAGSDNTRALRERLEKLVPAPGVNTRLRLEFAQGVADLSGPTRCELLSIAELEEILKRLGPDPLYEGAAVELVKESESSSETSANGSFGSLSSRASVLLQDKISKMRQQFIANMKKSARPISVLVMDQKMVAGPGNIYRAECLFICGINPHLSGKKVSTARLGQLWDCLSEHMHNGKATGRIITFFPDDEVDKRFWRAQMAQAETEVESEKIETDKAETKETDTDNSETSNSDTGKQVPRYYVYQREGQNCYRCGRQVQMEVVAGRKNYWCPGCQR